MVRFPLLTAACLTILLLAPPPGRGATPEDAPAFTFDGRDYFLKSSRDGIFEFLTAGETFEDWTTLISVRHFTGLRDPKAYAEKMLQTAEASSPRVRGLLMENAEAGSYLVEFLLPEGEGDSAGYEWNLWRVERQGDGLEAVQFARRLRGGAAPSDSELAAQRERIVPELAVFKAPDAAAAESPKVEPAEDSSRTYSFPPEGTPQFTMLVPGGWELESDADGAWMVSRDKTCTASVLAVDPAELENAVEAVKKQQAGRFERIEWQEAPAGQDQAGGMEVRTWEGAAVDQGAAHRIGLHTLAKAGAGKAFLLVFWTPEAAAEANADGIRQMLGTARIP